MPRIAPAVAAGAFFGAKGSWTALTRPCPRPAARARPSPSALHRRVGESPAHSQHGAASLQENIAALDQHHAGHIRNYAELKI